MFCTEHMRSDPAYRERLRACGLDTVARVLARVDGRITAWSRTTDTLFVPGPRATPGFYVKRHFFSTWNKRLRGALRGTFFGMHRGEAEYRVLESMLNAGVPAVRPVAYGSRRIGHFLASCFLITEEVPDAVNLTTFALDVQSGRRRLAAHERRTLLRVLAGQLAAMHAGGSSHGNLFWRNLLVRYGPDGTPEFFFLDPQPMHTWERLSPGVQWWQRELAQLAVSAERFVTPVERLRFLKLYLGERWPTAEFKASARLIAGLAAQWQRHEERRIRMNGLFEAWNRQLELEQARERAAAESPS